MRNPNALALALATVTAGTAHAGGLILNDHGAKAAGRADAVVATDKTGSAIFYNPAGLALGAAGYNIMVGGSIVAPQVEFTSQATGATTEGVQNFSYTPQLFVHGDITDVLKFGAGIHAPFGARTEWPEDHPGREQSIESRLRTLFISGVLAADLSKWVPGRFSVAAGFDVVPADVEITRAIVFGQDVGTAQLAGQSLGFGGRAGVMWEPVPELSLGVSYRSQVSLEFSGDADIDIAPPYRSQLPPDGDIETGSLKLPHTVFAGIAYRPTFLPNFEFEFDFNWLDWSSLGTTDIIFSDGTVTPLVFNWEDGFAYRFGLEYSMREIGLDLRTGFAIDRTPIPDDQLGFAPPDANRYNISGGASYQLPKRAFIDFGVVYGIPVSNTTADEPFMPPVKGQFDITFFVASLSLGINFGQGAAPAQ